MPSSIKNLGYKLIKNKIRNMNTLFINAENWRSNSGVDFLQDGDDEKSVKGD